MTAASRLGRCDLRLGGCSDREALELRARVLHGVEQWLVKWRNCGEDRNTWEPWAHLLTEALQDAARKVKVAALPTVAPKMTVPLLRQELEERGVAREEQPRLKAELVARLLDVLS